MEFLFCRFYANGPPSSIHLRAWLPSICPGWLLLPRYGNLRLKPVVSVLTSPLSSTCQHSGILDFLCGSPPCLFRTLLRSLVESLFLAILCKQHFFPHISSRVCYIGRVIWWTRIFVKYLSLIQCCGCKCMKKQ